MVYFKENYSFPRFQRGSNIFRGGGEGGPTFSGLGVQKLISIETFRNYDFPGRCLDPLFVDRRMFCLHL